MDEELPRTGIVSPQMREELEKREIEVGQTLIIQFTPFS